MIRLASCPKGYHQDQDKAVPPEATVARVRELLAADGVDILAETRRIDTGRLGIPVFLSVCGHAARAVMPTRKQMGKGAGPAQAEASALMELVERYSFFTFWQREDRFVRAGWSQARERFGDGLMDIGQVTASVGEDLDPARAARVLDLVQWRFHPATDLARGREVQVPLDWFRKLGEFNGSSAGNTVEESILQGAAELVERHVCAIADRDEPALPTIRPESLGDPVLAELHAKFTRQGIRVLLKDFTMGMPAPTVAAMAHDPATFPVGSELVFTAGTASSPAKAAIRALTEVAQLGGDFETCSVYEASGLAKYPTLEAAAWLRAGPLVDLDSLPSIERADIMEELTLLCRGLDRMGLALHSVDISNPGLGLPAHYNFVPGFRFRERDRNASLGLFVGRILAEEAEPDEALAGLDVLEEVYPGGHFTPFFRGLLALRTGDTAQALARFAQAEPMQPDPDSKALAAFYAAYALTGLEDWQGALPALGRAVALCPDLKEYWNLRGVCLFKLGRYEEAAADFTRAVDLDSGSATDLANLGICCRHLGEADKARHCLAQALELDPSLDYARKHLAELEQ